MKRLKEWNKLQKKYFNLKKSKLSAIMEVAKCQKSLLIEEDFDGFTAYMDEREVLIGAIDILDEDYRKTEDYYSSLGVNCSEGFLEEKKEVKLLLLSIQSLDDENKKKLVEITANRREDIKHARNTMKGIEGYTRQFSNHESVYVSTKK